jgi:hypothetical protein
MKPENPIDRESQLLQELLDGDPLAPRPGAELSEDEATLERLYTELLGLIPQAIEPVTPSAQARAQLLAAIAAPAAAEGAQPAAAVREPWPSMAELRARSASASGPAGASESRFGRSQPPATRGATHRLPWAVAALLAMALAGTFLWFNGRLQETQLRAERLQSEVEHISEVRGSLDDAQARLASLADKFSLVTAQGVEICPIRPPRAAQAAAADSSAHGVMYMRQGHWYLKIEGLEAPPTGQVYQLWFVTDVGAFDGGTFETTAGSGVELGSPTMPTGTTAVRVTLEPADGAEQPTGPTVLFGDQKMTLL